MSKPVEVCRYCTGDKAELIKGSEVKAAELIAAGMEENAAWRMATRCQAAFQAGSFPFHAWAQARAQIVRVEPSSSGPGSDRTVRFEVWVQGKRISGRKRFDTPRFAREWANERGYLTESAL